MAYLFVDGKSIQEKRGIVNKNATGCDTNGFALVIKEWPKHNGNQSIDIPFATTQLFAINIPLRYNPNTKEVNSDFINANISVSRVWGKTRFYESEFVNPRDSYWGIGAFAGMGTTKNSLDKEEVGFLYGGNLLFSRFGVNLIGAAGFESSVSKDSRTSFYLGFGIGFDLFKIAGLKRGSGD